MNSTLETDLDLEKLFLPSWAQEQPAGNRFEKYTGTEGDRPERKRGGSGRDSFGGGGGGGGGRGQGQGRPRSGGPGGGGSGGFGGPRFGDRGDRKPGGPRRDDRGGERQPRREPRPEPAPLPDLAVTFAPVEHGVDSLARQIRMTGRAYPLFQIAQLVLDKPERYNVLLAVKKNADGTPKQALFSCALDDTPWLSEDEAVAHVLKNHFATFYTAERTATEPPKGVYTFVAQCGFSGVILGPPNHHDYQNQLRKLHAERFARMPFEAFKARVKIVKEEAVVKKWIEDQSFKTEFVCLNVAEPLRLPNMEEVEKHFRATHKDAIIKPVDSFNVAGVPSRALKNRDLQQLVRVEWEQLQHFPLPLATSLSRSFASHGLHFFKVNKTVTHVAVARPQYLDLDASPVSENIKRIVTYINEHPKCARRKLVEALAPSAPAPTVIEIKPDEPKAATPTAAAAPEPTAEQTAIMVDLHWLVHQGHVLEFANGKLETAKKPAPKPPKPEAKPAPAAAPATPPVAGTEAAPTAEAPLTEVPVADIEVAPELEDTVPAFSPEDEVPQATPAPVAEAAPVATPTAEPMAQPIAAPIADPIGGPENQNVSVPPGS